MHNPGANAFLGDGVAPFRKMLQRTIPVCLGTDGGCTNSRQSVFDDMRMAALLAKAVEADAGAMRAEDVLLAGTARGGEILELPVGRIAPDHAADLVVVDLDALSMLPAVTAPKQVVYSMQPDAIARVLVAARRWWSTAGSPTSTRPRSWPAFTRPRRGGARQKRNEPRDRT